MEFAATKKGRSGEIGLAMLGTISAFSIWSAVNPSFFTIRAFNTPEHEKDVRFGMNAGLILDIILGGALYLAYGKKGKWPAILTAATGVGLWGAYHHILKGAREKGGWTETKTAPGRPGGRVYSNIPDNDMLHVKQVPGRPMPGMNQSELNAAVRNLMGNENNAFK